jgi:hypothetical protein
MADINDLLAILGGGQIQAPQQPNMQDRIAKMVELGKQQALQSRQTAQQFSQNPLNKNVPLPPPGVGGTLEDVGSYLSSAQRSPEQKKAFTDTIENSAKPIVTDAPGGKYYLYTNGEKKFVPEGQKSTIQSGPDQLPVFSTFDPETGKNTVAPILPTSTGGNVDLNSPGPRNVFAVPAGKDPLQGMAENRQHNVKSDLLNSATGSAVADVAANEIKNKGGAASAAVGEQQGLNALSNILSDAEMAKLPIGPGSKEYKDILAKANTAFQIAGLPQISPESLGQSDLYSAISSNLVNGLKGTDSQVAKALEANPDLAKNPQGVKNIINYYKALNTQKIGINKVVSDLARTNPNGADYNSAIAKYMSENPVLPPGSGKNIQSPANQDPNGSKDLNKIQSRVSEPIEIKLKNGKTARILD